MSLQVSQREAAAELLRRRGAREKLLDFTTYTLDSFEVAEHHQKIAAALERVERGECKRLMIFAPPRHGKSEIASKRFPAWYLGRNPSKQLIATTYSHEFAGDFGREVRNIISGEDYGNIFDVSLRSDSKSANRWHTSENGIYVSTGIGGAITGRGGDIILIDDVCKNREEADSEVYRRRVWNWYTSTLYTRLMPGGSIIIIMTRWHEDDLAGRLLEEAQNGGDQWEVIELQAIAHEDTKKEKALWPEWYDLKALKGIKKAIGPRDWGALYQQNPKPIEGTLIQRSWFHRYTEHEHPENLNIYVTSDFATQKDGGDFTEFGVWGIDEDSNIWALDWWYGQESTDEWIKQLLLLTAKNRPMCFFGESGVIRRAIEPFLLKEMRKDKQAFRCEWITRGVNKVLSLRGFQGLASQGQVYIPRTDWGDRLINQLCEFPAAKHDDAVDVCSLLGMALDDSHPAIAPAKKTTPKRDRWAKTRNRDSGSWRV